MKFMYDPKWLESEIRDFSEKYGMEFNRDENDNQITYELKKNKERICNVSIPLSPRAMLVVDYDVIKPEYFELRNKLGTYYQGKMFLKFSHNGSKKSTVIDTTKVGFY